MFCGYCTFNLLTFIIFKLNIELGNISKYTYQLKKHVQLFFWSKWSVDGLVLSCLILGKCYFLSSHPKKALNLMYYVVKRVLKLNFNPSNFQVLVTRAKKMGHTSAKNKPMKVFSFIYFRKWNTNLCRKKKYK